MVSVKQFRRTFQLSYFHINLFRMFRIYFFSYHFHFQIKEFKLQFFHSLFLIDFLLSKLFKWRFESLRLSLQFAIKTQRLSISQQRFWVPNFFFILLLSFYFLSISFIYSYCPLSIISYSTIESDCLPFAKPRFNNLIPFHWIVCFWDGWLSGVFPNWLYKSDQFH